MINNRIDMALATGASEANAAGKSLPARASYPGWRRSCSGIAS